MPSVSRPRTAIMQMMAAGRMPLMMYYIADRTGARLSDAMFVSMFFVWNMIAAQTSMSIEKHGLSAVPLISGFPAAAYDLHTSEGRVALNRFGRGCSEVADLLKTVSPGMRDTAIRHAVFIAEGGSLNEHVSFDHANAVESQAHAAELAFTGLYDRTAREALIEAVRSNIRNLDRYRTEAVRDDGTGS